MAKYNINVQRASQIAHVPDEKNLIKWAKLALQSCSDIDSATLTIRVVNQTEGRNLNNAFRDKDYATNVLTFVYHDKKSRNLEGDIVLCAPVVNREAKEQKKPTQNHYAHLTIHGVLHLAGLDHVKAKDAKVMEATEVALLQKLKIADPYADGAVNLG
jgi:probable rRNA maturation factor